MDRSSSARVGIPRMATYMSIAAIEIPLADLLGSPLFRFAPMRVPPRRPAIGWSDADPGTLYRQVGADPYGLCSRPRL